MDVAPAPLAKRARSDSVAPAETDAERMAHQLKCALEDMRDEIEELVSRRDGEEYWYARPRDIEDFAEVVDDWCEGCKFDDGAFASVVEAGRVLAAFHYTITYRLGRDDAAPMTEEELAYPQQKKRDKVLEEAGLREAVHGLGAEEVRAFERVNDDMKEEYPMENFDEIVKEWLGRIGKKAEFAALLQAADLVCAFDYEMAKPE